MTDKETQQKGLLTYLAAAFDSGATQVSSYDAARDLGWTHDQLIGIMKSLEMMFKINTQQGVTVSWKILPGGEETISCGSPEWRLLEEIKSRPDGLPLEELKAAKEEWKKAGQNVCLKNRWASSANGRLSLATPESLPTEDAVLKQLQRVKELNGDETKLAETYQITPADLLALSKRKMLQKVSSTFFQMSKSDTFSTEITKLSTDLNQQMLQTASWKTAKFKPYNWNAAGVVPRCGSTHPLINTLNMFRNILVEMGFTEMPTRRWVESCFWNFDALFQPQTHPVRDAHDTFFMKNPVSHPSPSGAEGKLTREYFERVKKIHEVGDGESLGWQCEWKEDEACKLIMRTHTTAISSQMLRELGKQYEETGVFTPKKFFSIDRVFRNETLDATHLAEFHQVEGVIADRGASLASLMGFIAAFYEKIGITQLKFKPAYNPYTEPSMEIFGYHPLLKKWTEIGNSGVFRPEMLRPMGLPADVNVLGWGLSLERPTMISQGVRDIRELFGPKAKLNVF